MPAPNPANALEALRKKLVAARQALPDRLERSVQLQHNLRAWLVGRRERSIGAYWPIKGEFDPLPALYRWSEGAVDGSPRRIGLPVADRATKSLRFHVWYPGCETELDAYGVHAAIALADQAAPGSLWITPGVRDLLAGSGVVIEQVDGGEPVFQAVAAH